MNTTSGIFMSHSESFKYQIISKYLNGGIYRAEAARLLSVSNRSITRYANKIKKFGISGVKHGNQGNLRGQKHSTELLERVRLLYKEKYYDFNLSHFHEILEKEHKIKIPYKTLWLLFKKAGLIKHPRRRRPRKHAYRTRLPQEGLLLQMDGSHHKFNGKEEWCLIAAIDDATSNIPYAEFFSDGETTLNCMKVLAHIIERKGVPKAIYTDRAGWSGGGKRTEFGQFKRACDKLGIQLIFADTPEAKGRIERSFRTIQDRLIPELRLAGIEDIKNANHYLRDTFLEKYWNQHKVVQATNQDSAYSALDPWLDLTQVFCIEEDRIIGRDQTVSWQGQRYIIDDGNLSLANYLAIFRTDLLGHTRVYVLDREVKMIKVIEGKRRRNDFNFTPDPTKKIDLPFELWGEMHNLILHVGNAVKSHKITGKPLQINIHRKKSSA